MMQLTKAQKKELIGLLKMVDVKRLEVNDADDKTKKWFRFGSYNGLTIASEIIKAIPEKTNAKVHAQVS